MSTTNVKRINTKAREVVGSGAGPLGASRSCCSLLGSSFIAFPRSMLRRPPVPMLMSISRVARVQDVLLKIGLLPADPASARALRRSAGIVCPKRGESPRDVRDLKRLLSRATSVGSYPVRVLKDRIVTLGCGFLRGMCSVRLMLAPLQARGPHSFRNPTVGANQWHWVIRRQRVSMITTAGNVAQGIRKCQKQDCCQRASDERFEIAKN
jgi:hypothetical protein